MEPIKTWNWQQDDWPNFRFTAYRLQECEAECLLRSGVFIGVYQHIIEDEKPRILIELVSEEAVKTSQIEGEYLNRDSVQSSVQRQLGLATTARKVLSAEQGIAEMLVDLYHNFADELTHESLFAWHRMLTNGRRDLENIGAYRTHVEPMQVVSGRIDQPKIHFEAPPSAQILHEMDRFIAWFNDSSPCGKKPLSALLRASIAHLYFVSIHPFEDGNGRIGRALVEKSLAQSFKKPTLFSLSQEIYAQRKNYYDNLEQNNKSNQIDNWLDYFTNTILNAQMRSLRMVEFVLTKAKFYNYFSQLNPRQRKVIERIFAAGVEGFSGGLSAENYCSITGTSRATASRDLTDLVTKGAFIKIGIGKGTRYQLNLSAINA